MVCVCVKDRVKSNNAMFLTIFLIVLILSGTLGKAYETLRDLAIESGASEGIELIQMRDKDRTIMFGLPGTLENVENGSFPPPPPPPKDDAVVE